jgi:hypothetical protein
LDEAIALLTQETFDPIPDDVDHALRSDQDMAAARRRLVGVRVRHGFHRVAQGKQRRLVAREGRCLRRCGHLIVDECHHLSASSFELVARRSNDLGP